MMGQFTEMDLLDTLRELGIQPKERGKELQLPYCPFCEKDRKKISDHFSFNRETTEYHCVKCSSSGNLLTFRREMGLEQPFTSHLPRRHLDQTQVSSYTKQPEGYYDAYAKARGIPAAILTKYGIGKYQHPTLGVCRTYPYIESGEIVNVKYVNRDKKMVQEKDAGHPYFGLQFVDFTKAYLYIAEGEDDCMALVAMGFDNVVSLPNGARSYTAEMGIVNGKFKKLHLFFDNDGAGEEGAESFARKAGVWKCWRVHMPWKDAREALQHGVEFFDMQQYLAKATQYEYAATDRCRPALNITECLTRYERECADNLQGIIFGIPAVDDITGGLRSDVFTLVANPECYKTTLLLNMLLRVAERIEGIALFFSLEMGIESALERELQIARQVKTFELRKLAHSKDEAWNELRRKCEESTLSRIYTSEESHITIDEIISIIQRTEECHGKRVQIVGIDYLDFVRSKQQHEYDAVRETMNGIKSRIARALRIPVIVLAQTNRMSREDSDEIGMRSGKGGTGLESASDFMIGLWRENDGLVGRFTKHRRIDSGYTGYPHPYLSFTLDKPNYRLIDVQYLQRETSKKKTRGASKTQYWDR
jgi:hypothetical protein